MRAPVQAEDDVTWLDEEIGALLPRPRRRETWGPGLLLGEHLRLHARQGYRAAVTVVRPGIFEVALLPEAVTRPEIGFLPLLPAVIHAATAKGRNQPAQPAQGGAKAAPPADRPQRPNLVQLVEAVTRATGAGRRRGYVDEEEDEDDDLGCERCACRTCRRGSF